VFFGVQNVSKNQIALGVRFKPVPLYVFVEDLNLFLQSFLNIRIDYIDKARRCNPGKNVGTK